MLAYAELVIVDSTLMTSESYVAPNVSIDAIVFQIIDEKLCVLLIQRAQEPFKGEWALPGGYNPRGETTKQAMLRVLKEKAGIKVTDLGLIEQLYTFDTTARDPRGHAISVSYMGLSYRLAPQASKTTQNPQFFPLDDMPPLAYDHSEIINYARERLIRKIAYTNAVYALLPKLFTLSQLQIAYEAVIGKKLDKRNFRKRFLAHNITRETDELYMDGAHRPARLYTFKKPGLQLLHRFF